MADDSTPLLRILQIGRDTSMRGAGVSLWEALTLSRYRDLRASFGPEDLRPLLDAHRDLLEVWFAYSEDKRTTGGWYLTRSGELGQVADSDSRIRFGSPAEAVAEYVVRELDFWSSRGGR
jgi:hypothetical protein